MPTVGSLFAGIGGFDLGFERAGFKTVWQVEKNAYCRRVLRRHFPDADRRVTDVRFAGARNLLPVDVICGGFPCQDISNAGLRAGIDGARSGLWFHMHRIISELRPRYVVVENVAALLGRGMGRVLGDLSEIGYDAEWQVVSAADVGAPHLRERVWITAYRKEDASCADAYSLGSHRTRMYFDGSAELRDEQVCQPGSMGTDVAYPSSGRLSEPQGWQMEQPRRAEAIGSGEAMAYASGAGLEGWAQTLRPKEERGSHAGHAGTCFGSIGRNSQWDAEPNVGRVAHGVPARVDRLRALGNAVVPQIPELLAKRLLEVMNADV